ncbi:MAG: AGE family epimerase/isomerase [Cyanobacteria bacterium P01_H01_bin.15]
MIALTELPLSNYRQKYEQELFERVIPFWENYSPDRENGGYFNCLDRSGKAYDRKKYVWLQGRQTWMFAKLYSTVEPKAEWRNLALLGIDFLRNRAVNTDGRVYFCVSETGEPVYLQRKIFSECFYAMALAECGRISERPELLREAEEMLAKIWEWAFDWSKLGRPSFSGADVGQSLAVPMILLNLIDEIAGEGWARYRAEIDDCIRRVRLHCSAEERCVREFVAPDGSVIDTPEGRLLNPGHAIEAGWFLQHWAQRLQRPELSQLAIDMVHWSFELGWDYEYGGIYYFLDVGGFSPTQLEWFMKLWWVHCEALYAHLLNFSLTRDPADWDKFVRTDTYTFEHFSDPQYGEWYGYLDRRGSITHSLKGGPYKGCFHVPRALLLCWQLLQKLETET